MRRATTDTANIPPLRGSHPVWECLYCRPPSPAPLLQPTRPPRGPQPQCGTKVPRERRRRRRSSGPGQLLGLRQSGLPGRPARPQQVPQGVREQLLLARDVSSSSSHVPASPASPVSRAGHLLPARVDLDLPGPPPGPPHGRLRHHAAHLTSQRSSSSSSRWSVSVWPLSFLAPISHMFSEGLKFNYQKIMQIAKINTQINLNLFRFLPIKNTKHSHFSWKTLQTF